MRNSLRHTKPFNLFSCRAEDLKNFLLCLVNNCNKPDLHIRICSSYDAFRNALLKIYEALAFVILVLCSIKSFRGLVYTMHLVGIRDIVLGF